jgi:N-acyl homoserine lactone hydrolase
MTSSVDTPVKLYFLRLSTTSLPIGEGRFLDLALGCYLIETSQGRHILVDSGMTPGVKLTGPSFSESESNVIEQLAVLGLRPEDIDTVLCTHFDVDHAGYHDSFPNAEFIVQRAHYHSARAGHPRFALARQHWDHPALRYRLVDGDTEILPGLTLIETSGHVAGHQSVLVRLPRTGLVLLAIDAVMMKHLFTPDRKAWPDDENEEQLVASTQKLLGIVEREKVSLVVFGHDGGQWKSLRTSPEFYD